MDALNAVDGRGGDYAGKTLVLHKAFFRPKYQVGDRRFNCTGGFGAKEDSYGRKVYGIFLSDGEEAYIGRGDVEGLAVNQVAYNDIPTERERVAKLPRAEAPPEPNYYLALNGTGWAKGETVLLAIKGLGKKGRDYDVYYCHPGTVVTDMGGLSWEDGTEKPKLMERVRKGVAQEVQA
jgi:hypothetical protein